MNAGYFSCANESTIFHFMKTSPFQLLPILALALSVATFDAAVASVNIPVTYRGYTSPDGTNQPAPAIDAPVKPKDSGNHATHWRKDPATNRLIPVFQVGTGENLRMLSLEELKAAAENGDTACQKELSYLYETGVQGVGVDSIQAYKWAALAESADAEKARRNLRRLELFMKPSEIEQAKKAVADFRAEAAKKKEAAKGKAEAASE